MHESLSILVVDCAASEPEYVESLASANGWIRQRSMLGDLRCYRPYITSGVPDSKSIRSKGNMLASNGADAPCNVDHVRSKGFQQIVPTNTEMAFEM